MRKTRAKDPDEWKKLRREISSKVCTCLRSKDRLLSGRRVAPVPVKRGYRNVASFRFSAFPVGGGWCVTSAKRGFRRINCAPDNQNFEV